MKDRRIWMLIRNFAIEMVIYGLLVVGYFFLVLRLLGEPLKALFDENKTLYAFLALVLIVAQAVVLGGVASFLMNRLKLERFD